MVVPWLINAAGKLAGAATGIAATLGLAGGAELATRGKDGYVWNWGKDILGGLTTAQSDAGIVSKFHGFFKFIQMFVDLLQVTLGEGPMTNAIGNWAQRGMGVPETYGAKVGTDITNSSTVNRFAPSGGANSLIASQQGLSLTQDPGGWFQNLSDGFVNMVEEDPNTGVKRFNLDHIGTGVVNNVSALAHGAASGFLGWLPGQIADAGLTVTNLFNITSDDTDYSTEWSNGISKDYRKATSYLASKTGLDFLELDLNTAWAQAFNFVGGAVGGGGPVGAAAKTLKSTSALTKAVGTPTAPLTWGQTGMNTLKTPFILGTSLAPVTAGYSAGLAANNDTYNPDSPAP